jgi:hypothetical protein
MISFKYILIALLVVLILAAFVSGYFLLSVKKAPVTACTMEAKLCPGGSVVGRTGASCKFADCPAVNPSVQNSGIIGTVLLGPTCPVEKNPPDPKCADKLFATTLEIISADKTQIIKQITSDSSGRFAVNLVPGEYLIQSVPNTNILPRCSSNGTIVVVADQYTKADVSCDTGIR